MCHQRRYPITTRLVRNLHPQTGAIWKFHLAPYFWRTMYGQNFTTPCSPCYNSFLPELPEDDLVINAGLTPAAEYYWVLETAHGITYKDLAVVDGDGKITIPIANFPNGLFAAGTGRYVIYLVENQEDPETVPMTLGLGYMADEYECISLVFYPTGNPYLTQTEII